MLLIEEHSISIILESRELLSFTLSQSACCRNKGFFLKKTISRPYSSTRDSRWKRKEILWGTMRVNAWGFPTELHWLYETTIQSKLQRFRFIRDTSGALLCRRHFEESRSSMVFLVSTSCCMLLYYCFTFIPIVLTSTFQKYTIIYYRNLEIKNA